MSNFFFIFSNCVHSLVGLFRCIFSNLYALTICFVYVYMPFGITFLGISYLIFSVKKVRRKVIASFLVSLLPVVIIANIVIGYTVCDSIMWSKNRIDLEKKNEVLFKIYDENADTIGNNHVKVEFNGYCVRLKLYNRIGTNDSLYEGNFVSEVEYFLSEEDKSILNDANQFDEIIIKSGKEIIYIKIIPNKNPIYCSKMRKVKYNRAHEYTEKVDRYFKDFDRKWCEEEYYIGEGKVPRF